MRRASKMTCALWFALLWAQPVAAGSDRPRDWREWPVIPIELARGVQTAGTWEGSATRVSDALDCPASVEFAVPERFLAPRFDINLGVTQLFVGDYDNDRVIRYDIDQTLSRKDTALALSYGLVWLAVDLDLDGNIELVIQRGDPGGGGNGYLDIHSAPEWNLRARLAFPGEKVTMYPVAVNMDADPHLEIYVTPNGLFGSAHAVIVDYQVTADTFIAVANILAPRGTGGQPAVGDFDDDGRTEFISGNDYYYGLFEYDGETLSYIGQLGDTVYWNNFSAAAVRPKPGGVLHALLGHSSGDGGVGFRYQLLEPTGDNTFSLAYEFLEFTGAVGIHPCYGADTDCDGLDELIMHFYPLPHKVFAWDTALTDFVEGCTWDFDTYGTFVEYRAVDLDQNGAAEWATVNHNDLFRAFPGPDCVDCDSLGQCPHPGPYCACDCHGDPQCDGTPDVFDIVRSVEVAFRNAPAVPDPQPFCPPARTDVDCSGETDVFDVVRFVNVIFRNEDQAANYCDPCVP